MVALRTRDVDGNAGANDYMLDSSELRSARRAWMEISLR